MPTAVRRLLNWLVLPLLGLAVSVGGLVLVTGPLSWFTLYGSWPSDGGDVAVALLFAFCMFLAVAVWLIAWFTTQRVRRRRRAVVLVVALLFAPAFFSASTFATARTRWCEIRATNGPDPRLNTVTGPLAPHCEG